MKNCTLDGATRPPPPPPPPPLFLRYHPQHPQHPQHLTRPLFYIFVSLRSTLLASASLRWPKTSVELFHHRTRSRRLSSHEKLNRYFRYFCRRHKRRFFGQCTFDPLSLHVEIPLHFFCLQNARALFCASSPHPLRCRSLAPLVSEGAAAATKEFPAKTKTDTTEVFKCPRVRAVNCSHSRSSLLLFLLFFVVIVFVIFVIFVVFVVLLFLSFLLFLLFVLSARY